MAELNNISASAVYTTIDLNATGRTTVLDPTEDTAVYGVYVDNVGGTAEFHLEITDGTDTATLQASTGGGANIDFGDNIVVGVDDSLQVFVETAEGTAGTTTAVVVKAE